MKVFGVLAIIVGCVLAAYVGGYLLFVGGLVQIIDAAKENQANSTGIAWGVLRMCVAGPTAWFIFFVSVAFGLACIESSPYRNKNRPTAKQGEVRWRELTSDDD